MDEPVLVIVGIVIGVGLLYLGGRIRSRAANRPRPRRDESSE